MAKKVDTTPKTTAPTGLSIARDNKKFTFSWTIADSDYDDGQECELKFYYKKLVVTSTQRVPVGYNKSGKGIKGIVYETVPVWGISNDVEHVTVKKKVTTKQTSVTHSINVSNYMPSGTRCLTKVEFRVRGNKNTFTKTVNKKKYTIKPTWSSWSEKSMSIKLPYEPVVSQALDQSNNTITTFSWTNEFSNTNERYFRSFEWESDLTEQGELPNWVDPAITRYPDGVDTDTGGSDIGSKRVGDVVFSWDISKTGGYVRIAEDSNVVLKDRTTSHTRHFRVRARGPHGYTDWKYATHVYAWPRSVSDYVSSKYTKLSGNRGTAISLTWKVSTTGGKPIDYSQVKYAIASPKVTLVPASSGQGYTCKISIPDDLTFNDAPGVLRDSKGNDSYSFVIDSVVEDEQMIFLRVDTTHDRNTSIGEIYRLDGSAKNTADTRGFLKDPSPLAIQVIDTETRRCTITVPKNNSEIENSILAIYFRTNNNASQENLVSIIPWGQDTGTKTIQLPSWKDGDHPGLGVRAYVASYKGSINEGTQLSGFGIWNVYMSSNGINWAGGVIALPPTLQAYKYGDSYDTIETTWNWNWSEANSAELSWANNKNAWMSTSPPSTFVVSGIHASKWHITGLDPRTWWVKCRLLNEMSDRTSYGAYSAAKEVKLSSDPYQPLLSASATTVVRGSKFSLYWAYSNDDGTSPNGATLYTCTLDANGNVTGKTQFVNLPNNRTYDQTYEVNTSDSRFAGKTNVYFAVEVKSNAGDVSALSLPLKIAIAPPLTASITSTSLTATTKSTYGLTDDPSVVEGKTYYRLVDDEYVEVASPVDSEIATYYELYTTTYPRSLTTLPLTITVAGTNADGRAYVSILRKKDYFFQRPGLSLDDMPNEGFAGETIATVSRSGSGELEIDKGNLLGYLDDGQEYDIRVVLTDSYGQTATTDTDFIVAWSDSAKMPEATLENDQDKLVQFITPTEVSGSSNTDTVDIYRLSADKPELIVEDAQLGTTYVDPYPTLGDMFGGYRIVYKTKDGNSITDENKHAVLNADADFDYFGIVIDFAGRQIRLPYDVNISNKWTKDFTEVKYLGGSVRGFWNPAVSRTSSLRTTVVIDSDYDPNGADLIRDLRRLADYSGLCHIRTPDGSSYSADIEVSEDREERWVNRIAKFSIETTRINAEDLDGMTLEEWNRLETAND